MERYHPTARLAELLADPDDVHQQCIGCVECIYFTEGSAVVNIIFFFVTTGVWVDVHQYISMV
jgi:hypothetical protein